VRLRPLKTLSFRWMKGEMTTKLTQSQGQGAGGNNSQHRSTSVQGQGERFKSERAAEGKLFTAAFEPTMWRGRKTLSSLAGTAAAAANRKPRVVILGTGWGGFRLARDLNRRKLDVSVVSPRNHFLFTPLLPSTTVGTLEFRCVQEPVRTIAGIHYHQARADSIDLSEKHVRCTDVYRHGEGEPISFRLPFDKLVVAVGTKSNTFGVPGFRSLEEENTSATGTTRKSVFFLKQLEQARSIRNRIIECFERAASPFVGEDERKRLLTFLVVGGGPTSIEFTSELCDFIRHDVAKWYSDLGQQYNVIVVEAGKHLLGAFDSSLSSYVERTLVRRQVTLLTNEHVKEIKDHSVVLGRSGEELPFGLCVWATGNAPLDFVRQANLPLTDHNRIAVDDKLRVEGLEDVYAVGDCAAFRLQPLPMLAQVANQQGAYLAKCFNKGSHDRPFQYKFMGAMAQLGTLKAVADLGGAKIKGLSAFLAWRSAYWTMSVSITNKILIPM